jgi:hypothetical protein
MVGKSETTNSKKKKKGTEVVRNCDAKGRITSFFGKQDNSIGKRAASEEPASSVSTDSCSLKRDREEAFTVKGCAELVEKRLKNEANNTAGETNAKLEEIVVLDDNESGDEALVVLSAPVGKQQPPKSDLSRFTYRKK